MATLHKLVRKSFVKTEGPSSTWLGRDHKQWGCSVVRSPERDMTVLGDTS